METFLIVGWTFYHPIFYPVFLPALFQVFPVEAESVVVAQPEVFPLVSAAAELSPGVVSPVAQTEVFVLVSADAELSPGVVVLAAEPGVVFVGVVSVADVVEPQASVDIAVAFVVLVPASVVVVEVDSSGRPKSFAFPNICSFPTYSSSGGVVGEESVHSPTGARTNDDLCSILSNLGLHQNKNLEHCYNNPSPGYNNVSDTNALPKNATTNRSRNTSLHHHSQGQRRRKYQVTLLTLVVRQIRWVVGEEN